MGKNRFNFEKEVAAGGTVVVPSGVHYSNIVTVTKKTQIIGEVGSFIFFNLDGAPFNNSWTSGILFSDGSAGSSVQGLSLHAGTAYAGINTKRSATNITIEDCNIYGYSYKAVAIHSDACATRRIYCESDLGNGSTDFANGGIYPMAVLVDPGERLENMINSTIVEDIVMGPHPRAFQGPMCKIAQVENVVVRKIFTNHDKQAPNKYSLVLGEGVGKIEVSDCVLPNGISYFNAGDPNYSRNLVKELIVKDCILGIGTREETSSYSLVDHLNAERVTFDSCVFNGIDNTAIMEETPTDKMLYREYSNCTFKNFRELASHGKWQGQVLYSKNPIGGDWVVRGCRADNIRWSSRSDVREKFDNQPV